MTNPIHAACRCGLALVLDANEDVDWKPDCRPAQGTAICPGCGDSLAITATQVGSRTGWQHAYDDGDGADDAERERARARMQHNLGLGRWTGHARESLRP